MSLEKVITLLKAKRNIFITGPGGTGKSWIVKQLVDMYPKNFTITSSTGISAYNLFPTAKTIHKFSGIGMRSFEQIHYDDPDKWDEYLEFTLLGISQGRKNAIKYCGYVVIDEISMISKGQLDLINAVFKVIKDSDKPFGGMGVIITGDFLQLPPVVKRDRDDDDFVQEYAFDSRAWKELNLEIVYLTEIKRSTNLDFITMLNQVRLGYIDDEFFFKLKRSANNVLSGKATNLVAINRKADAINDEKINELEGELITIRAKWRGDKEELKDLKAGILEKDELRLKVGCRVMITVNQREYDEDIKIDSDGQIVSTGTYVNGSQGVFLGLEERETKREVKNVKIDPVTKKVSTTKEKRKYEVAVVILDSGDHVELRRFSRNNGIKEYDKETGLDQWQVEFSQYPIILAYAITQHKSQGLTIPILSIECNGIFSPNQFYVAISRGQSFETVCVKNLREKHIKSCPRALAFYKEITDRLEIEKEQNLIKENILNKGNTSGELQTNV